MTPASARRLRGAADRRAAERRGTPPPLPARGARARRRRRKPGMTQPSCVSDGESHLRTPHVSSFGAEACAAAASARPTSSHPPSRAYYRTRLEPTLAVARARRACVLRVRPGRARRACECGSRSFGRPTARAARAGGGRPSASHGRGTAPCPWPLAQLPHPTLRATLPRPRPRSSLSTPSSLLGSQVRALADEETRPVARLPVRAAAPPPPRARVTAQQRRRHDDEIRQTSSYPCLTALLRRSILRVSRPSPPPSALARPAPGVARTTRPTAHPPWRRLADLEKVHGARRPRHRRLGAPPPRRHARSPRPARGRCIPFAVTPLVRA